MQNKGEESLSCNRDELELLLQTIQTLNLKMYSYYKRNRLPEKVRNRLPGQVRTGIAIWGINSTYFPEYAANSAVDKEKLLEGEVS